MIDLTKPEFQYCLDPNRRHDFVLLFEVTDGNPNGDPDAGNMPRVDPETMHGLVTDVCLKRKVRNYVALTREGADGQAADGYDIYVKEKAVLSQQQGRAYQALRLEAPAAAEGEGESPAKPAKDKKPSRKADEAQTVNKARDWMCQHFYDIRMFGAVMSLKENNAGQVRGPMQMTFARSESPIVPLDVSITRMAVATQKEAEDQGGDNRTMGRKALIPYGLYRGHGFFSAPFAQQTGVSSADLQVFWEALMGMWDHDHSAARGLMSCRGLYVFSHENKLGSAPAHQLFDRLELRLRDGVPTPRRYADYVVTLNRDMPQGVTLTPLVEG